MHPKPLTLGMTGGRGGSWPCHQPDTRAHTAAAKTRVLVQLQRAQTRCPGPGPGAGGGHQGPQAGLARGEAWRPRPTAPLTQGRASVSLCSDFRPMSFPGQGCTYFLPVPWT